MESDSSTEERDMIFSKIDTHYIRNTKYHSQRRKSLHFYEPNQIYYKDDNKVSSLDLETGEIVENLIPKKYRKMDVHKSTSRQYYYNSGTISVFMKTKNYFMWSFRGKKVLYVKHHEDDQVHECNCSSGYQFNEVDLTKDEKYVFVVGQFRHISVFELDREKGLKHYKDYNILSCGNDVRVSPDGKYVAAVTDGKGFQIFEIKSQSSKDSPLVLQKLEVPEKKQPEQKGRYRISFGVCDMCHWSKDSKRLGIANNYSVLIYNVMLSKFENTIQTSQRVSFVMWSPSREDILIYANHNVKTKLIQLLHVNHKKNSFVEDSEEEKEEELEEEIDTTKLKKYPYKIYSLNKEIERIVPQILSQQHKTIISMEFSKNGNRIFGSFYDEKSESGGVMVECFLQVKFRVSEKEKQHIEDLQERTDFLFLEKEKMYKDRDVNNFHKFRVVLPFRTLFDDLCVTKLFFL